MAGEAAPVDAALQVFPEDDLKAVIYAPTHVCNRVLLGAGTPEAFTCLSVFRPSKVGNFSDDQIRNLQTISPTLMALLNKHVLLLNRDTGRANLSCALTSLPEIIRCMSTASVALTRREGEVCARIVYGVSTAGIAIDLNVSEEMVTTYRKRAYQRLGIATRRELLVWYIDVWNARDRRPPGSNLPRMVGRAARPQRGPTGLAV